MRICMQNFDHPAHWLDVVSQVCDGWNRAYVVVDTQNSERDILAKFRTYASAIAFADIVNISTKNRYLVEKE